MTLRDDLAQGLEKLNLNLASAVQQKLLDYLALIEKWNRVYNLTAVREPGKMLSHHIFDSLAVLPFVTGAAIADVGSGAGLPGIPLALAMPDAQFSLIESNQKKSAFLNQAVIELGLGNATIIAERVEASGLAGRFDCVLSRAFSDVGEFVALAGGLCKRGGVLAAMKGVYPYDELAQIPEGYRLTKVVSLQVPGLAAARHLALIEPVG